MLPCNAEIWKSFLVMMIPKRPSSGRSRDEFLWRVEGDYGNGSGDDDGGGGGGKD